MLKINDLSILLVEPSATQNKLIVRKLREAGIDKIDGVASGQEALVAIDKYQPDLVISAMYLDDMTAIALIEKLRNKVENGSIAFMLVSSEACLNTLDPIKQAGVVAILPKPFDLADLKRALRSTLETIEPNELELNYYDIENLRVLVVDDSPFARKHIVRTLANMGMEKLGQAADGQEAVKLLQENSYDLVVTDYNMPNMDGGQLVEFIRKNMNNAYIPILMVTSEENQTTLSGIEQSGVSAIVDKPFDSQNVRDILARLLDETCCGSID